MMSHVAAIAAAALTATAAISSCAPGGRGPADGGPPLDFTIHGLAFSINSGAVVSANGALTFYLSDQPRACEAIRNVPVHTATTFSLRVAAQTDGTTRAAVVARKPTPSPGEAVGGLKQTTGTTQNASVDAADGSVAWSAGGDGTVYISTLDIGFVGTTDRLTAGQLTLTPCP